MRVAFVLGLTSFVFSQSAGAQSLAQRADSAMRDAERNGFSGVVRLEKDGAVVLEKGYGKANRATGSAFTPATVVQIGSNTKDFTAVAILQLQERGKLKLDDTLGKFFPGAPPDKSGITVKQLLDHTAGFPLGLGGDFEPVTRDELIANAMKYTLPFKPGSGRQYSNTGFAILAAIIEKLSGKTYDAYVRDNILSPLGLRHTGYLLPGFTQAELAHGYASGKDAGSILNKPHAADGPYWNLRGNGGMLSTVGDMHTFYKALFETDKLLKPATRDIMFNPNEPVGLAGSDLVNVFLYERDPIAHTEMIIASTNADQKAPVVRRALAQVFGLPLDVGGDDGPAKAPAMSGNAPVAAIAAVIQDLINTINKGDKTLLLAFLTDHFENGPSAPKPEERLDRIGGIHDNLGNITIDKMAESGDGPVRVSIVTGKQGGGMMLVDIDRGPPYKIKRIGLQIGN